MDNIKKKYPSDWNVLEFGNFVSRSKGRFNPNKEDENYKCIELKHLDEETGRLLGFTYAQKQKSSKNKFKEGQILYGKLRPYLRKYWRAEFEGVCSSEIWVLDSLDGFCSNRFLFYLIQTHRFNQIANVSSGTKMPRADWGFISEFPFAIPPKNEREGICSILSTWDQSISTLEQLIQAKKRYKKGLMQQLLSGKKRFPEFEGEWKTIRLKDIFDRVTRKNNNKADKVLTISSTGGFLDQTEKFGEVIAGRNLENYILLKRGEFAYNKGNSLTYPQGCIFKLEDYEQAAVPNVYYCFKSKEEQVYSDYYKYYFELGLLNHQLSRVINTGVRNDGLLNLYVDDFFNIELFYPPIKEQKKIAKAIDPIDKELILLEGKLLALKKQKKGLMQQLLTGKVRVDKIGESHAL